MLNDAPLHFAIKLHYLLSLLFHNNTMFANKLKVLYIHMNRVNTLKF